MTDKPFVERWAARKAATRAQPPAEPGATESPVTPEADTPAPPAPPAKSPATPISEAELAALPPIDTLAAGSDIKAFLRPGVPAALKNAAMRKMWLATPAIRDHKDIAVDYAWDWNTPGGVPGDGGPLHPGRVAQWVRELAGKAAPGAEPQASPARPPEAEAAPTADPADIVPENPQPTTRQAAPPPATDRAEVAPEEGHDKPAHPRHGGARPG